MELDSIEKRLGIDYESPEWKAGVISYNNRILLKYDIESGELVRLRRLLREGNIEILDKDNQILLADFIDYAISKIPQEKKKRGRPNDDEINKIELQKHLNDEYNRLHFDEGLTIDETLENLSKKTTDYGKSLGKKRVDQLCLDYRDNEDYYKERLRRLYTDFGNEIGKLYQILVDNEEYIDYMSRIDDCKIEMWGDCPEEIKVDKDLHNKAILKLAQQFRISEGDVEKRLSWYRKYEDDDNDY
ncbi:MAG: hypothetical protein WA003_08955 [Desulfuromonadaceae bacterium]